MTKVLKRLVYRSKSLVLKDDVITLQEIFAVSIKNNKRHSITGCLAQPDGHFVQVIEGEAANVDRLMDKIIADARHEDVITLGEWNIQARLFQGWDMARPDITPLSDQSFRIINTAGSGAQVVGVLLTVIQEPARLFHLS
ncbi:MAG: BLUF domain-containing protein [Alphaproteobacteria bacterium]|nr:MAG: BLUF domain-containing protein [Alphaproteobacteria bacterium]